ncbi:hypothetical protein HK101_007986 [Irineochytrium annulatum]|nr:hypothetical protein HK101_007986 [Irineochytrium annulatum]
MGIAKALLPLKGKPLLDYWLADLDRAGEPCETFIVCNDITYSQFVSWAAGTNFPVANILNDGSRTNEARLGAVADLALAIDKFRIGSRHEALLVIAGDTLFFNDFDIKTFLRDARARAPACLVTAYSVPDEDTRKTGIVELDSDHRVIDFKEKPAKSLKLVEDFLAESRGKSADLQEVDATGKYLVWMISRCPTYATLISGRLDIGGLNSFIAAEAYMGK